ncbi:MAG: Xaa-Pro peptidase family protein [Dehalogenimonas sp.]|uniref:Xaa-Pro peptidase family protein n=1 Tax=Candidatus Dehalogenimonas loeffleri TaxID=3127115 RepID=A0ABZ2J4L3_9CHLR|nr:Xaa-Pro peptidase family protein [Dehalogenimonas sp.]
MTERLTRLRQEFSALGVDGMLIAQPDNRYYLSGFDGSSGYLLITSNRMVFAVDFRYVEQAKLQAPGFEIFQIQGKLKNWLPELLHGASISKLGLEANFLSMADYRNISGVLSDLQPAVEAIHTSDAIEMLRMIKDAKEISLVTAAVKATERAMLFASEEVIKPGISEKEAAWQIEKYIRHAGGELAFPIIVAGGAASAMPHAQPSERPIQKNEPIVVDLGVRLNKYCGDLTRTFWLGEKSPRFEELYRLVLEAQTQAIANISSGHSGVEADAFARDIIDKAGYGQEFGHGLGHGIGLAVHELPRVSTAGESRLTDGMIFTVEPGLYIPGWGGIRIEDDVLLEYGKIKQLSTLAK